MGVHSNITPRNYAQSACGRLFAASRPHNWRYVQVPACQGALRAPCKVRLAPRLSKRALTRAQERSVPIVRSCIVLGARQDSLAAALGSQWGPNVRVMRHTCLTVIGS